jgi:hypothetical protein
MDDYRMIFFNQNLARRIAANIVKMPELAR